MEYKEIDYEHYLAIRINGEDITKSEVLKIQKDWEGTRYGAHPALIILRSHYLNEKGGFSIDIFKSRDEWFVVSVMDYSVFTGNLKRRKRLFFLCDQITGVEDLLSNINNI